MRKYWLLFATCTPVGILLLLFLYFGNLGKLPSPLKHFEYYLISILLTNFAGIVVYQIDKTLDKRISWRESFLTRFISGILVNMVVALSIAIGILLYGLKSSSAEIWKFGILITIVLFLYEIFYGWFYSYRHFAYTQVEWLRSERWQLELQFESLKSQISPHFLFNCLNTISSLLYKDSKLAEEFIRRMAETFQYVLTNQKRTFVSLREELEFVKSYYYLLQVRFENNLKLEINIPKNLLDSPIPPLTLQMLIENAVKHNQIDRENHLMVYLSAKDNTHLLITNTKTTEATNFVSTKVGLENIRKRYSFFTKQTIEIRNNDKYTVQLPVLKENKTSV
jgi:two-component system LytT family sensor kinase